MYWLSRHKILYTDENLWDHRRKGTKLRWNGEIFTKQVLAGLELISRCWEPTDWQSPWPWAEDERVFPEHASTQETRQGPWVGSDYWGETAQPGSSRVIFLTSPGFGEWKSGGRSHSFFPAHLWPLATVLHWPEPTESCEVGCQGKSKERKAGSVEGGAHTWGAHWLLHLSPRPVVRWKDHVCASDLIWKCSFLNRVLKI